MVEIALPENMLSKPFKFERPQPEPGRLMSTAGRTCFKHFKSSLHISLHIFTPFTLFADALQMILVQRVPLPRLIAAELRPETVVSALHPEVPDLRLGTLCSSQISLGIGKKV